MPLTTVLLSTLLLSLEEVGQPTGGQGPRLRVFIDCSGEQSCYDDYLRETVQIAEYVRDRTDADVHVLVTVASTASRGFEYTLAFIGQDRFASTTRTLRVTTESTDTEDTTRRRLASALTLGLLGFLSGDQIPADLSIEASLAKSETPAASASDPWNRWIFSINGSGEFEAEESTEESELIISVSADRITPDWKLSFGTAFNNSGQSFDLDEDEGEGGGERLSVETRSRSFNWLVVRSAGEHWSFGGRGGVLSSTFDNTELDVEVSPAIEWNFFPYSMYTRRQLRVEYSIGPVFRRYYEETLFGKTEETRGRQQISGSYEQREPWGTLEASLAFSNFFPGLSTNRVSVEGEANIRIFRGLSLSVDASASRIRDQLALPRRDATPEEVLLRLRQLSSGFETRAEIGLTYQFGSRFASIVNPRFGQ
jgi:hypothetical protein